jgi:hypothetical protein
MPIQDSVLNQTWFSDKLVHALQSSGMRTKGMTTETDDIEGNVATFYSVGSGEVTPHPAGISEVPTLNAGRNSVSATVLDWDADEYIKKRDMEKTSLSSKEATIKTVSNAIGREFDRMIMRELVAQSVLTSSIIGGGAGQALDTPTIVLYNKTLITGLQVGLSDIYCAVPDAVMTNWMMFEQFGSAGWAGDPSVAKLTTARTFMGVNFFVMENKFFTEFQPAAGQIYLPMWHRDCVGRVTNFNGLEGIFYESDKKSYRVSSAVSGVCKTILPEGVRLIHGLMPTAVTIPSTNG